MAAGIDDEVWRFRVAGDVDAVDRPGKRACRRQCAFNAVEYAEVRSIECELTLECGPARILVLPRPERARRLDLARRQCIGQRRFELHPCIKTDALNVKCMHRPDTRR